MGAKASPTNLRILDPANNRGKVGEILAFSVRDGASMAAAASWADITLAKLLGGYATGGLPGCAQRTARYRLRKTRCGPPLAHVPWHSAYRRRGHIYGIRRTGIEPSGRCTTASMTRPFSSYLISTLERSCPMIFSMVLL